MKPNTEPTEGAASRAPTAPADARKPRVALFIATGFGLGYLPKAPGTWGSLLGVALAWVVGLPWQFFAAPLFLASRRYVYAMHWRLILPQLIVACIVGPIGVLVADRAAQYFKQKDPQRVVIDEVSGQHLALAPFALAGWKYLLLGFILFRVFDIWKPFPAQQAERLPGGWGIMTDDWVAGVYAAIGLWAARALGL